MSRSGRAFGGSGRLLGRRAAQGRGGYEPFAGQKRHSKDSGSQTGSRIRAKINIIYVRKRDPFSVPLRIAFNPLLERSKIAQGRLETNFLKFWLQKWFRFGSPGRLPNRLFEDAVQKPSKSLKLLSVKH